MKRVLFFMMVILFITSPAMAQSRGVLTNVWASWMNVTSRVTINFPSKARDITIINGDSTDNVCVSLTGEPITSTCTNSNGTTITQIPAGQQLSLYDYNTSAITLQSVSVAAAASPVSVVVTY